MVLFVLFNSMAMAGALDTDEKWIDLKRSILPAIIRVFNLKEFLNLHISSDYSYLIIPSFFKCYSWTEAP